MDISRKCDILDVDMFVANFANELLTICQYETAFFEENGFC